MKNEFDNIMSQRTDAELIQILNGPPDNYQPAALEAARRVFEGRNLSDEKISAAKQEIEQDRLRDDLKSNEPLPIFLKIIAFIFPGILLLLFAGLFKGGGYDKKAKDLTRWTLFGFGFYFGIALLSVGLSYLGL
ncbi:MAG: hypothetical protein JO080_14595 [Mucilaginibacter sp.]|nr:hypothetical protein [Mucilaginibacter sp.]